VGYGCIEKPKVTTKLIHLKVELSINLIYSQSENINIKKESENEQNYYVNLFFVSYWMFSNK